MKSSASPWRRRVEVLGLVVLSGAPGGVGFVGVLGRSMGSPFAEQWAWAALVGFAGACSSACLVAAWWHWKDGEGAG